MIPFTSNNDALAQLAAHAYISAGYRPPMVTTPPEPAAPEVLDSPLASTNVQLPHPSTLPRDVQLSLSRNPVVHPGPTQLVLMLSGKR